MNSKPVGTVEQVPGAELPTRLEKFQDNAWGEGLWHVYVTVDGQEFLIADVEGRQRALWYVYPIGYRHPITDLYKYVIGAVRVHAAENAVHDFVLYRNVKREDTKDYRDGQTRLEARRAQLEAAIVAYHAKPGHNPRYCGECNRRAMVAEEDSVLRANHGQRGPER